LFLFLKCWVNTFLLIVGLTLGKVIDGATHALLAAMLASFCVILLLVYEGL